ncbi:Uncharacterised protein [Yersinia pseudotuberculosis]|nr:Uncharacterised protein [Yersinia pseudotuberculosis]
MRTVIEGKKVILVGDSTTTGGKGNLSSLIKPIHTIGILITTKSKRRLILFSLRTLFKIYAGMNCSYQ